jgi:hypothetical protein
MATEDVIIVEIDGNPVTKVVPAEDPAILGQIILDRIALNTQPGERSGFNARIGIREIE